MEPIRFDGRLALITGAGRGLGRAYALLLAERGARIVVHDAGVDAAGHRPDRSVADAVVAEITSRGGRATAAYDHLGVAGSGRSLVERIESEEGSIDVLIHSAGISARAPLEETAEELLSRVIAINALSAIELVRAVAPAMAARGYGRVVLTVSGHGLYPDSEADLVAYGISKAMQFGLMNTIAEKFARDGVLVNAISPVAATRMLTRPVQEGELRPEAVAPGVAYLASSACDVSGVVLRAAGGRFSIGRYAATASVDLSNATQLSPETIAHAWADIARGPFEPVG
jgi:NAD(P)-dependent dehydrogenase (short-subunit alcohol dehydrogenase family)